MYLSAPKCLQCTIVLRQDFSSEYSATYMTVAPEKESVKHLGGTVCISSPMFDCFKQIRRLHPQIHRLRQFGARKLSLLPLSINMFPLSQSSTL